MKNVLQYWSKYLRTGALLGVLLVGAVSVASFTNPTTDPSGGNLAAPVNKSSFSQEKSGNFAAASLGAGTVSASNLFCLGADSCISDWWDTPEQPYSDLCTFERIGVFPPAATDGANNEAYQDYCRNMLTAEARQDGWVPVSSDSCTEDRNTCTTDGIACVYTRLVCDGESSAQDVVQYTEGQAVTNNLYPGAGGGSNGNGGGGNGTNPNNNNNNQRDL
jgi:hypothetical protein